MKVDRYFHQHYKYYIREMRIIAYNQLLESYSSLTLSYMANAFGVSNQFIDKYFRHCFFPFFPNKLTEKDS